MSRQREAKRLLFWSLGLVLAVNVVVLAGVAWNRSGEPEARLLLSERELQSERYDWLGRSENSGRSLQLRWRIKGQTHELFSLWGGSWRGPWLERDQLSDIGFTDSELAIDPQRRFRVVPARQAWVAFELDGPAYAAARELSKSELEAAQAASLAARGDRDTSEQLQEAQRNWTQERTRASRLFAIDVDRDHDALRSRYSDRSRYLIVRASIEVGFSGGGQSPERVYGYIDRLHLADVHVPRDWHREVDEVARMHEGLSPAVGFEAVVVFGRRLEPWIESLHTVQREAAGQ
jgi:hypothetical protein